MDLSLIRKFMKKVQALDILFQDMQTLKQQEIGLKLLTSLLKRNETRLGGRFKMKTVIWYNMKDFEKLFDMCYSILFSTESECYIKDKFITCLSQFSISDYDIVKNLEEIVRKLALQFDSIELTLDYNDENSILASENDSNDYMMGIDVNYDVKESENKIKQVDAGQNISDGANDDTDCLSNSEENTNNTNQATSAESREIRLNFNDDIKRCADRENANSETIETKDTKDKVDELYSRQGALFSEIGNNVCIDVKEKIFQKNVAKTDKSSAELSQFSETLENDSFELDGMEKSNAYFSSNQEDTNLSKSNHSDSFASTESQIALDNAKKSQNTISNQCESSTFHKEGHPVGPCSSETDISCEIEIIRCIEPGNEMNNTEEGKEIQDNRNYVNNAKSKIVKLKIGSESKLDLCQRQLKTEMLPGSHILCGRSSDKHGHFTRSTNKNFKVSNILKCRKPNKFERKNIQSSEDENVDPELDEEASKFCQDEENDDIGIGFSKSTEHITSHGSNLEPEREYPCSFCEKRLPTRKSVIRHMKVVHDTEPNNTQHRNTKTPHSKKNGKEYRKGYRCDVCNQMFSAQACYVKHTQTFKHCNRLGKTDGERTYLCQLCGKAYLRKDALKRHEKFHSGEKSHMCQFCGYKCRENHNLKRHIALHFESQRNFICEICGAAFHTKKTMEVHHQFKHSEERNYKCESCDKAFKAKSTLIRHKKVHNQAKDNRCWCGSAFKTLYNLRRHMKCTHGSDSKLPSKHYVKTLDCPVKTTVSKTDYLSKAEKQTTANKGNEPACFKDDQKKRSNCDYPEDKYNSEDDHNELGNRDDTYDSTVVHGTVIHEEKRDPNFAYKTQVITKIPTIESFRHIPKPHGTFNTAEYTDSSLQISDHVQVDEHAKDKSTDTYLIDNVETEESPYEQTKANVPQFSLYGYPPPYSSSVPKVMYMQPGLPRFEPTIHPPLSYMSYDQLAKIGPAFQPPLPQSVVINPDTESVRIDLQVSRAEDASSYQSTPPSLSQDQLRVLHHEIYSRLSQEEIAQRLNLNSYHHSLVQIDDSEHKLKQQQSYEQYSNSLLQRPIDTSEDSLKLNDYNNVNEIKQLNSDTYNKDLSDINNTNLKLDDRQTTLQFDYTDRKNCALEGQSEETLVASKLASKTQLDQSQEDMYDSSIDADYLQSRREMAAESLALMSALTPESTYGGQELNDQML